MPQSGSLLGGRYSLLDRVGTGVCGEVWRGRDESTGSLYAVKLLRPELAGDEGALARLRATIAWIGQLTHPGIIAADALIADADSVAVISRLVPGESLRRLLDRQGALPTGAALVVGAQLCDALAAARRVGVAHGDVKPANLLLEPDPQTQIALRLTDFGMAALLGRAVTQQVPNTGAADGYAAPELEAGEAPTEAADVYAAAAVLQEALTGQPPIGGPSAGEARHGATAVPLPADLPDAVADALAASLGADPRLRPSAASLAATLRQGAEEVQAREPGSQWPVIAVPAGPVLDVPGDITAPTREVPAVEMPVPGMPVPEPPMPEGLASAGEEPGSLADAPQAAAAVAATGSAGAGNRRTPRPWIVIAAALCGVALAAFVTFGLTTHGSPHAAAPTRPPRVAVIGPTKTPDPPGSATPGSGGSPSPTPSATPSGGASPSRSASAAAASPSATLASPSPAAPSPSPSGPATPVTYTGRLKNAGSGRCLDTSGGYFANGVVEQIWDCDNGIGQVFTLNATGQLTVDGGRYCLGDAAYSTATGTHPQLWTCGGQSHQRWTLRADGSFAGDHSGLCLNVPGTDDGTQLDFEPCDSASSELWAWN